MNNMNKFKTEVWDNVNKARGRLELAMLQAQHHQHPEIAEDISNILFDLMKVQAKCHNITSVVNREENNNNRR